STTAQSFAAIVLVWMRKRRTIGTRLAPTVPLACEESVRSLPHLVRREAALPFGRGGSRMGATWDKKFVCAPAAGAARIVISTSALVLRAAPTLGTPPVACQRIA